jgi:hypothetical protein
MITRKNRLLMYVLIVSMGALFFVTLIAQMSLDPAV